MESLFVNVNCNHILANEADKALAMWDNKIFRAQFTVENSSFIISFLLNNLYKKFINFFNVFFIIIFFVTCEKKISLNQTTSINPVKSGYISLTRTS